MQNDWTKPAAMAIPKGGSSKTRWNRAGTARSFPRLRRATASRSSRRSCPAASRTSTSMPRRSRRRWPRRRTALAVLKLHYLRWVLFDIKGETYFMYQGIFDTDFDKYTEDAVAIFAADRLNTVFENLEGFPRGLEDECPGVHQIRPRAPLPELPGIRRVPLRERRRDQEGPQAQGGVLQHARPDAVMMSDPYAQ